MGLNDILWGPIVEKKIGCVLVVLLNVIVTLLVVILDLFYRSK